MAREPTPLQPGADSRRWLDTPLIRQAGRDMLSLALMDARNHTLQLATQLERSLALRPPGPWPEGQAPLAWLLGEVGWFQERWVGRNLQRALGARADASATRLASVWPEADRWWEAPSTASWALELPSLEDCRFYLLQTLESTLELLAHAPETDEGLYFFRLSLLHEDQQSERLVELAQALALPLDKPFLEAFAPPALVRREPLLLPACTWLLGSAPTGFAFDAERPQQPVAVPEFEIDAQPVSWSQFVEFVDDGAYDRPELWSTGGWAWLEAQVAGDGRRGPRYVEQIGVASGAVMQQRFGVPTRLSPLQPVMHVSWWEAEAWCRWAGRRLPLELEWEVAAETASRRGFRWGDVWEWTASSFRPYPGYVSGPDAGRFEPWFGRAKVLRGGSTATRARLKSPRHRAFAEPGQDLGFCGFRSCAP